MSIADADALTARTVDPGISVIVQGKNSKIAVRISVGPPLHNQKAGFPRCPIVVYSRFSTFGQQPSHPAAERRRTFDASAP
jgi:hypothetical protein